jgi:hypothetical protein
VINAIGTIHVAHRLARPRVGKREVNAVQEIDDIAACLRNSADLPGTLAAGFDAFELIRLVARSCEDLVPVLFPRFHHSSRS